MDKLTTHELMSIKILIDRRLRAESKRPSRPRPGGLDLQAIKVKELTELSEKLERMISI